MSGCAGLHFWAYFSRYQIIRELGRGGMGVVYLARDRLLMRDVAIKVMTPDILSQDAVERFRREARVVAGMDHPAIVGVYDIGEQNGSPLIPASRKRFIVSTQLKRRSRAP